MLFFKKALLLLFCLLFPVALYASFIESTIGTAVVNDATATYYNPAALVRVKKSQIIAQGSVSSFRSVFTGTALQTGTGFSESGRSTTRAQYYLPSFYWGMPTNDNITIGVAILSNFINQNPEDGSILRYVRGSNNIRNIDFIPAIGVKFNSFFSLGAGINFSYADFLLQPISGFPSLTIPDATSRNEANGFGLGGDVGLLLKLSDATVMGLNYRSAITYNLSGKSTFESNPEVVSPDYSFHFWTPARSVFSINHFVTPRLGFIGTLQRIQWSIFNNVHVHNVATQVGSRVVIVDATIPYHLRNTWLLTLGTHYHISPQWVLRVAGSYNQSAGNPNYQIANGDSIILGASAGYTLTQAVIIDAAYAHAFVQNQGIHITGRNQINGTNTGAVDSFSLKLTFNL